MNLLDKEERSLFCTDILIPLIKNISKNNLSKEYSVKKKGQGNYVTDIDIRIEQDLVAALQEILPASGFVAEEDELPTGTEYNWIIDPIDGTTNFINGLPFAVSVALEYVPNHDAIIGVVYNPETDEVYYACKGTGSYLMARDRVERLHTKQFQDDDGLAIFGMPYNRDKTKKIFEIAESYYAKSSDLKRIGPASLDICLVAAGKAKVYFELDLNIWDIAASTLILTEAGGKSIQKDDLMIFCNGQDC